MLMMAVAAPMAVLAEPEDYVHELEAMARLQHAGVS
jgi:hypothetical protein